jgi:colicin import membrane protein
MRTILMFPEPEAPAAGGAPPVKLSKLQMAMNLVSNNMTEIQVMSTRIDALTAEHGEKEVFAVATKEGRKKADEVRKTSRDLRLSVSKLKKASTDLLNDLKKQAWAVADPFINKLQAIEDNAKTQIEAEDSKEEDRKQRHTESIGAIRRMAEGVSTLTVGEVRTRIAAVQAIVVDNSYEEFEAAANRAKSEVHDILDEALRLLIVKEQEEKELAERRTREARQSEVRQKIAELKNLPAQCTDTGRENIEAIIRQLQANPPAAADYDDFLEFAEMAHEKALRELGLMRDELTTAAIETEQAAANVREARADDDGPQAAMEFVDTLPPAPASYEEEPAPFTPAWVGVDLGTDERSTPAPIQPDEPLPWEEAKPLTPPADPDPFTAPKAAPPRPAPARRPTPTPGFDSLAATGRAAGLPVGAPPEDKPLERPEEVLPTDADGIPDLMKVAELVLAAFDRLPKNVTVEWEIDGDYIPDAASLTFTAAMRKLRDAVALLKEFPPA